jgi:hypothetical protein
VKGAVSPQKRALRAGGWAAAVVVLPVWTVAAGTGVLYLLYAHHLLGAGVALPAALPLESLAGHAGQPLIRAVAAWFCSGAAAGCFVGVLHRPHPGTALAAFAGGCAVTVVMSGAAGRALTLNQPLGPQVLPQLGSGAAAFAWGVLICGAAAGALGARALGARPAG